MKNSDVRMFATHHICWCMVKFFGLPGRGQYRPRKHKSTRATDF